MIGLRKNLLTRGSKKKTVIFDRFAVSHTTSSGAAAVGTVGGRKDTSVKGATLCAKTLKNCDAAGNVLRQGVGAAFFLSRSGRTLTGIPSDMTKRVLRVNLKRTNSSSVFERFLVVFNDGYVRLYDENSRTFSAEFLLGANTNGAVLRAEGGEERYLLSGASASKILKEDGAFYESGLANVSHALCVCKNRLFMAQLGGIVKYSDPLTPWDFSGSIHDGGYIQMPVAYGEPIEMAAVGDWVYVFYQRAIMRLTVRGSGKDFRVEEVVYKGAKIFSGTICSTSDGVIFLSTDGLWKLKGLQTERFCKEISLHAYAQGNVFNAVTYQGKYFLRYQHEGGYFRSVAVDLAEETWYECFDLAGLNGDANSPIFVRGELVYRLGEGSLPSGETSLFESVDLDFGIDGKKTLRKVTIAGEGSVTLKTYCDGVCVERNVVMTDGKGCVDLDLRGESFSFGIELSARSAVRSLRAEIVS